MNWWDRMGGSQVFEGVDVHKNYSWVCAMDENLGWKLVNRILEVIKK